MPPGRRLTSQSTSLGDAPPGGQDTALRLTGVAVWRWHAASRHTDTDPRRNRLVCPRRRALGAPRTERSGQDDPAHGGGRGGVPEPRDGGDPRPHAWAHRRVPPAGADRLRRRSRGPPLRAAADGVAGRAHGRHADDRLLRGPAWRRRPRAGRRTARAVRPRAPGGAQVRGLLPRRAHALSHRPRPRPSAAAAAARRARVGSRPRRAARHCWARSTVSSPTTPASQS